SAEEIIFTRNATEALNLVAQSWGRANLRPGDRILISRMEHHSTIVPWQMVAAQTGAHIKAIPLDAQGRLALDQLDTLLDAQTRIVALTHMSNVLGTINPIEEITRRAHAVGAIMVAD